MGNNKKKKCILKWRLKCYKMNSNFDGFKLQLKERTKISYTNTLNGVSVNVSDFDLYKMNKRRIIWKKGCGLIFHSDRKVLNAIWLDEIHCWALISFPFSFTQSTTSFLICISVDLISVFYHQLFPIFCQTKYIIEKPIQ